MALAGLLFSKYIYYLGVKKFTARLAGLMYAFCGWTTWYLWFNHFTGVAVIFPVILLGVEKILNEKIDEFMEQQDVNEESISEMMTYMREKTAYDQDKLTDYVMRRKAVIKLFRKMLDAREDGKYELEALIHNLIFPMGLTNREISYQYHNLWILDERFATYQFIASDKSITSFSKVKSSLEPDLVLINNEKALVDNPISYGSGDAGDVESMVIFEFKRPGQTAHQKRNADKSWEFSDLVDKYFDAFLYGTKKNYRGNFVNITATTPKFGYVILDVIDKQLEDYNLTHGW
jgi:hypothetical protein